MLEVEVASVKSVVTSLSAAEEAPASLALPSPAVPLPFLAGLCKPEEAAASCASLKLDPRRR